MFRYVFPFGGIIIPDIHFVDTHIFVLVVLTSVHIVHATRVTLGGHDPAQFVMGSQVDDDIPRHISIVGIACSSTAMRMHEIEIIAPVNDVIDQIAKSSFETISKCLRYTTHAIVGGW